MDILNLLVVVYLGGIIGFMLYWIIAVTRLEIYDFLKVEDGKWNRIFENTIIAIIVSVILSILWLPLVIFVMYVNSYQSKYKINL